MWQTGSACYSTPTLANRAAAAVQSGSVVPVGSDVAAVSIGAVTDSSIEYRLTSLTSGNTASRVVVVVPQECGLLTYADGLELGWQVALVWIVAYAVTILGRIIKDAISGGATYGNA